jgi:hypothetical protein
VHCEKGHAKAFSSELIHILLLKIPKVSNILRNKSTGGYVTNYFMKYYYLFEYSVTIYE